DPRIDAALSATAAAKADARWQTARNTRSLYRPCRTAHVRTRSVSEIEEGCGGGSLSGVSEAPAAPCAPLRRTTDSDHSRADASPETLGTPHEKPADIVEIHGQPRVPRRLYSGRACDSFWLGCGAVALLATAAVARQPVASADALMQRTRARQSPLRLANV